MSLRTVEAHQRFSLSARILTMKMLMIMIIMLMTFMNRCCLYSFNLSALILRLIGKSHTKSQAVLGLGSGCGCGSLDSINSLAKVTDGCIGDQCVWLPQPRATSFELRACGTRFTGLANRKCNEAVAPSTPSSSLFAPWTHSVAHTHRHNHLRISRTCPCRCIAK